MPEFLRILFKPTVLPEHQVAAIEIERRQAAIAERLARLEAGGELPLHRRASTAEEGDYDGKR